MGVSSTCSANNGGDTDVAGVVRLTTVFDSIPGDSR